MGALYDDCHAAGLEDRHDRLANLRRQSFLDLEPPSEHLDHPGNLGNSQDAAVGNVANVRLSKEGRQMVLAEGENIDPTNHHHFVVILVEDSVVDDCGQGVAVSPGPEK